MSGTAMPGAARRYVTVDVFTERVFGGNPLAVVLDAVGLDDTCMQAIATEFNYAETTFVLPPRVAEHDAQVRIFTPRTEVPFAGHPNVGTALVLAEELRRAGRPIPQSLLFEEGAGLVTVRLLRQAGRVSGAELTAPLPLALGPPIAAADVAASLSLAPEEIDDTLHPPRVASVGLPFLVAALRSRAALEHALPDVAVHRRLLPGLGTDAVFVYVRDGAGSNLWARMFAPLDGIPEDPATGSAVAATIALLATLQQTGGDELHWRVEQGTQMGRPSLLLGRVRRVQGQVQSVHVAGAAVMVMSGTLQV